jgi:arsenite methyltransferase
MDTQRTSVSGETVKQCCARIYESDFVRLLLGDSFHPGGLKLTERLGELLELSPESRVLDVASGNGTSAIFLAERFRCEVVGIDYGGENVEQANQAAAAKVLQHRVRFERADAESLSAEDASFDAVICECAFCTFPDKARAATQFARVLRVGGQIGLSDLTRGPVLPDELDSLLAWVACIADAQPVKSYMSYLHGASFVVKHVEPHDDALSEMVHQIRMKMLGAEIMVGLRKLNLSGVDFTAAKQMAQAALAAIQQGQLGYAIVTGLKC